MNALLTATLSNSLVALLLALFAYLLSKLLRNPPLLHFLWLLVLIKLVTPPWTYFSIALPESMQTTILAEGGGDIGNDAAGTELDSGVVPFAALELDESAISSELETAGATSSDLLIRPNHPFVVFVSHRSRICCPRIQSYRTQSGRCVLSKSSHPT